MTVLYYCMGGGLGHITRFNAFCHTTQTQPVLLTNCAAEITGQIKTFSGRCLFPDARDLSDKASLGKWLQKVLQTEKPRKLIVDAFPGGILGELGALPELRDLECEYLARILNINRYLPRINGILPKFSQIFRLEKLHDDHENLLNSLSATVSDLTLVDPPAIRSEGAELEGIAKMLPKKFWAIIHSGNDDEIEQLWQYARQTAELEGVNPGFVVVSPGAKPSFLPTSAMHFNIYPADLVMMRATRLFSAAGFNIMRQIRHIQQIKHRKIRHEILPFPRALDDQFFRVAACSNII